MKKKEQSVYLGQNSIDKITDICLDLSPRNIFLLRGKESYKISGAKEQVEKLIPKNINIYEFSDFQENPKIEDMIKGVALLEKSRADLIIAIGGGSVLDMAKLVRFCYSFEGDPTGKTFNKRRELIPLVAIPTTAGTGCEVTQFSVIYKDKVKYSLEHSDILPDYAIVYPPFTYGNNKYLTACTGFDALAQAIEAYWNVNATEESDEYALKAIHLLWNDLPIAVNSPTTEARDRVSEGAYWAGRAINITKTTAPHAFSYPFTTHYGYPHGHAVALTFPFFIEHNTINSDKNLSNKITADAFYHKISCLYTLLGVTKNNIRQKMIDFITIIDLNLNLSPKDIDRETIISHINIQRIGNNPRVLSKNDFEEALDYMLR